MRTALKVAGWSLAVVVIVAIGFYAWAYQKATGRYETAWTVHESTFPIPFPLREDEIAALREERIAAGAPAAQPLAGVDLAAIARDRAVARGQHLVASRVGCQSCHGQDLGGRVLVESPFVGRWVSTNLTSGAGSVTNGFTAGDWDRAVRHGVRRNGHSSSMPSQEFLTLSDRELSDIVSYVRSVPPIDRDMGGPKFGPVFTFLGATNPDMFVAFTLDHHKPHPVEPPAEAVSAEFGQHIVQVCRGCHGPTLSGGDIAGDPDMPTVANITPHETGLKDWTEADFLRALREGKRKDGTDIAPEMPWTAYGLMSDTELKAMWAYLRTVPAVAKGNH